MLIVEVLNNTLMNDFSAFGTPREAVMAIVNGDKHDAKMIIHYGSLPQFHQRLGHLCYDTFIKMAATLPLVSD